MPFDIQSLLQMLGIGGQPPAPQAQQVGNLAQAGFPGAQQMQQASPNLYQPSPPSSGGLQGMLSGLTGQGQQDPLQLAAQLGGATPGTPQYAQIQQAMQAAQASQQKRAMSMGLLQGGLSAMSARDPLGAPAGAISGLSQGMQSGLQGEQQYLNNARGTSQAMLSAQQAGQGLASGSMDLQTKRRLMQQYGLSDPQAIMMVNATKSTQGMIGTLTKLQQDPATPADVKARAAALLSGGPSGLMGMTPDKLTQSLYGVNQSSSVQALNTAKTNELTTRSGLEGYKAESGRIAAENAGGAPGTPKATAANAAASKAATAASALHDKQALDYIKSTEGLVITNTMGTDIDPHELSAVMADPSQAPPMAKFKDGEAKLATDPATGASMWWMRKGAQMVPLTGPPAGVTPGATSFTPGAGGSAVNPTVPE